MSNKSFEKLSKDKKVIFFLGLSEKVVPTFSRIEYRKIARDTLDVCWDWVQNKKNIGEVLYNLLDDEDHGITLIQEMSEIETDKIAWNCVIDAVAFTSRKAFEEEGVKYFPEPIELVDDTLVEHFVDCFKKSISDYEKHINGMNSFLDQYNNKKYPDLKTAIQGNL